MRQLIPHYPKRDNSRIVDWARKYVDLPESYAVPGKFNVSLSPWLEPIFDALQDDLVRTVTVSKSIQSGGTLIADVWVPWLICNLPGPISWTMHTEDMVQRHAKTRLNPILDRCEPASRLMPRHGPHRTITEIYFGGFFLLLNSANLSDQQSQSIRFKINDEIWHPRWQNIYKEAIGRVTKFEEMGTSKVLNISQGGWENDASDAAWKAGHMAEMSAPCHSCSQFYPLNFRQTMIADAGLDAKDRRRAGVVWDESARRDDGTFDEAHAGATARFRCPHCGHEEPDDDTTRERWRRTGHYVASRPDAPVETKSFHFESVLTRPMKLLAQEFCIGENEFHQTGSTDSRRTFRQKREARAWVEERQTITLESGTGDYAVADYAQGQSVPGEVARFMVLDRQQTHWWVEIGAWLPAPEYRQLYFGRIDTIDQVRALQHRYQVPDSCVAEDRRYQQAMVDADCLRFGWRGMEGVKKKTWTLRNEQTQELENYPHSDVLFAAISGGNVPYYQFSTNHTKDIVANAASGQGFKWITPTDVNPLYGQHLQAEEKKEVRPGVWEWVEVKQNQNHGFDTSSMMVAIAIIAGLIRFKLESND